MLDINTKGFYIEKIEYLNIFQGFQPRGVIHVRTIVMEWPQVKYNPGDFSNKLGQSYQ